MPYVLKNPFSVARVRGGHNDKRTDGQGPSGAWYSVE